jgi:competence protein ComEA
VNENAKTSAEAEAAPAPASRAPEKSTSAAAPARGLYSRLQVGIILVLVALLAAGLFVFKHRRRLNAEPIVITSGSSADYAFKVDVNTARWEEIALLPGIGETKAKAIVDYREKNGPFRTAADLTQVAGIGEKTVDTISPYIAF